MNLVDREVVTARAAERIFVGGLGAAPAADNLRDLTNQDYLTRLVRDATVVVQCQRRSYLNTSSPKLSRLSLR